MLWVTNLKTVLGRVLRRGSEKGGSRRYLERPLREYDPLGVRPIGELALLDRHAAEMGDPCLFEGVL